MPARNLSRINEDGIYLHIVNRGIENRAIFNDKEDYQTFIGYLSDYLSAPKDPRAIKKEFKVKDQTFRGIPHQPKNYFDSIELIAYDLKPDHFHLILHQVTKGSVEKFLRSLSTRYSIYTNKKYQRSGPLFAGPYKSVKIEPDLSLLYLTRYLHQNSTHSSLEDYLNQNKNRWVKPQVVLKLLENKPYKGFIEKDRPGKKPDLARIILENEIHHNVSPQKESEPLERSRPNLGKNEEFEKSFSDYKLVSNFPHYLAISSAVFLLLVVIGLGNIKLSEAKTTTNNQNQVTIIPSESTSPSAVEELPASPSAELANIEPEATESLNLLTVKIDDGAEFANIRRKPSINSPKVGQATPGEVFEFSGKQPGWYEIKLVDDSAAYISDRYVVEGVINE